MNKKTIIHAILIAAIVIAAFFAAALTPANTYAKTSDSSAVINIAKVDFESRTLHADKRIADNRIPMASAPLETGMNISVEWIIVAVAAVVTGFIIYVDLKGQFPESK